MPVPQFFSWPQILSAEAYLAGRALELGRERYVHWRKAGTMARLVGLMESLSLTVFVTFEIIVGILPERLVYWAWGAAYLPVGLLLMGAALALRSTAARLDEDAWKRARLFYRAGLLLQAVYMVVVILVFSRQMPLNQITVIQFILLFMIVWHIVFQSLDRWAPLIHPVIIAPAIALSLYTDRVIDDAEVMAIVLGVMMLGLFSTVAVILRRILQSTYELEYDDLQRVAELEASGESMRLLARKYSVLVAEVGHDLRQPVQAISLAVRSLSEAPGVAGPDLRTIETCATSLEMALSSMLDYSRLSFGLAKPERQSIELAPLLRRLQIEFSGVAEAKGVALRVDASEAVVWADEQALYRILGNLLQNALKFTHEGEVSVVAVSAGQQWQLRVTDSGPGISPERQAQIFEQFVGGDELGEPASRGLGLGLAIAQRFAETLGARLECVSKPGEGTRFSMLLPAAPRTRRRDKPVVDIRALAGRRVLLIDDDRFILDAMAGFLRRQGLQVQASTHFDLPAFGSEPPELIVSDHFLDGQPLGLEGIVKIRQSLGHPLPAILLTGDVGVHLSQATEAMEVVLIHKPVSPESLLASIARLLPSSTPPAPISP